MNRLAFLVFWVVAIQGCSTGYRCDLGHDCTDAVEALELAKVDGGNSESVFYEPNEYPEINRDIEDSDSGDSSSEVVIKQLGMGQVANEPVYIPDSPMRIWVAPEEYSNSKDDPIYLVDGYHLYGMIKGGWLLGNKIRHTNSSTSGSFGVIGPLDEKKDLGFKPTLKKENGSDPVRQLFR